ncbi:MAG: pre-peptidase C-terminal domain-containing protein, partial [Lentisphaerota bacterium]
MTIYDQNGQVLDTDDPYDFEWTGDGKLYLFPGINGTNYASVTCGLAGTGTYDLLILDLPVPDGADPYEFDNTPGIASNIVFGTSQTNRSIHHAADIDYIAFSAAANHYYRLDVTNVETSLDINLALCDTNGALAEVDDGGSGGDETISYFLVSGGTYYARVRNYSGTMEDTGTYHVVVSDLGFYPPDPYESDDTPGTASNIVAGIAQTNRTINWGTDLDYIKFTSQAYHTYRVDVTDVGASLNANLMLFAADGTTLLASSDTGGPGGSETISYLPLSAGTNYIRVRNSTDGMADTGAYHVAVADLGAVPADPYEPDNSLETASSIVVDVAQTNRTLHLITDVDYVKVALQSNRYYRFETYDQQLAFSNQLILLGTNGTDVLAQQTNNLEYRITSSGDYYLRVSAYATNAAGSYTLRVKDLRTRYRLSNGGSMCSPAIGDDARIYVAVNDKFYAMQPDGSSTQTWDTGSTVRSSPTLGADGLIYIAANNAFYIFNTNGTTTNGTANLNPPVAWPLYPPSPALGPTGAVYTGAITNRFYSLNALGQTNWTYPTTGFTFSAPAVDADGNIYFSCTDRWLRKLTSAGVSNWGVNLGQILYASPALDTNGNVVVAGSTGTVFLVSGTNGAILRTWQAGNNFDRGNSPVIGLSGTVYIVSGNSGRLYAFQPDGSTGSVWNMGAQTYGSTPAIGSDGTIYVGALNKFYAFNPNGTTSYVWNLSGYSDIYSSPAIDSQGLIYLNCLGTVYAFYGMSWPTGGLANSSWPMLSRNARHTGAMGPPGPVSVTASDGISTASVAVVWTTVTNADLGYEVWRGATNQPDTAIFLYATVTTNFTDINAAPGQPYSYWVKSRNYAGAGGFGGSDTGWRAAPDIGGTPPSAPTGVTASDGTYTDKVRLTWMGVTNASGYGIYRSTSSSTSSAAFVAGSATTNYDDTSATVGQVFYYWVKATNAYGASAFSSPDSGRRGNIAAGVCDDYDGDGKADLAVYHDGYWSIYSLANGVILNNAGVW